MESRVKVLGHPLHQILVAFPLGLFGSAAICDALGLVRGGSEWGIVAFYMIGGGIVGGAAASIFGLIDYGAIPAGTRAKRVGRLHGMSSAAVIALFAWSWYLRMELPMHPTPLALACSFSGAAIAGLAGWFGGELVNRMGVGIDDGAHLDAPSSMRGIRSKEVPSVRQGRRAVR